MKQKLLVTLTLSALLAACGGGGGGSTPSNAAPEPLTPSQNTTTGNPEQEQSGTPTAEQPTAPTNEQPTNTAEQPTNPTEDQPTPPAAEQPTNPSEGQPTPPAAEQPTNPSEEQPTNPTEEQPNPTDPTDEQTTPPTEEQPNPTNPSDEQPTPPTEEQPETSPADPANVLDNAVSLNTTHLRVKQGVDMSNILSANFSIDPATGKLILSNATETFSYQDNPLFDGGMNALKNNVQGINPAFGKVQLFEDQEKGVAIFLRDPATAGFQYQTFGQVFDLNADDKEGIFKTAAIGFVSIGNKFIPADNAVLEGEYKGIAMGNVTNNLPTRLAHSEVIADMTASLKFNATEKVVNLNIYNSRFADDNLYNNAYTVLEDFSDHDFSETLQWSDAQKAFIGDNARAYLYGPEAQEIGGTYMRYYQKRTDTPAPDRFYRGAFGGVKQ